MDSQILPITIHVISHLLERSYSLGLGDSGEELEWESASAWSSLPCPCPLPNGG